MRRDEKSMTKHKSKDMVNHTSLVILLFFTVYELWGNDTIFKIMKMRSKDVYES